MTTPAGNQVVAHDIENEDKDTVIQKMSESLGILRPPASSSPVKTAFSRRGERVDLFAVSHAIKYGIYLEAWLRVHSGFCSREASEIKNYQPEQWREALIRAVMLTRRLPAFDLGHREKHLFTKHTRGGFRAIQFGWRFLNQLSLRPNNSPWPTPEEAMWQVVHDYIFSSIKYGKVYADEHDYTGKVWFKYTARQYRMLFNIDPALLARFTEMPSENKLRLVDDSFRKFLAMAYSMEGDVELRVALVRKNWNQSLSMVHTNNDLPPDMHVSC